MSKLLNRMLRTGLVQTSISHLSKLLSRERANALTRSMMPIWFGLAVLVGCSMVVYKPPYINSFVTDDYVHLRFVHPILEDPFSIYKVFNPYFIGWYYRPIQLLYFSLFRLAFGSNPLPYYWGLLLLHALNIILVYQVGRKWGISRFGAMYAAGLFSIIAAHQGAVSWVSAVSIVIATSFSLLSLYSIGNYFRSNYRLQHLLVALLFACMAIFSREESLVLAPAFLLIWLFHLQRQPINLSKLPHLLLWVGFYLFVAIYVILTYTRPTWTPHASAVLERDILSLLSIESISRFLVTITGSYLAIEISPPPLNGLTMGISLISLITLIGLALWCRTLALRLGAIWLITTLVFIYIVVWQFTGNIAHRYLYLPWLGFALIGGVLVDNILQKSNRKNIFQAVAVATLVGFLSYQAFQSRLLHQEWQNAVNVTQRNEAQIKTLLPEINEDTHLFAYDMPPVTDYLQSMAAIWYNVKLDARGGHWGRLFSSGFATPNDHLFHFEDGTVYNVMPELQEYDRTVFVWQENPTVTLVHPDGTINLLDSGAFSLNQIIGPAGQKRFGHYIHPPAPQDGWASLDYTVTVPENSELLFGIFKNWGGIDGEDGLFFRLNVLTFTGDDAVVYETFLESPKTNWIEERVSMQSYWGQTIIIQFQVHAGANLLHDHGFLANPRFVLGEK